MLSNKDYTKMTQEELTSAAQKMKSQKIATGVFIGALVGIAIYSATHKGLLLPIGLLIFSFLIGSRHAQEEKAIQAEISRRAAK